MGNNYSFPEAPPEGCGSVLVLSGGAGERVRRSTTERKRSARLAGGGSPQNGRAWPWAIQDRILIAAHLLNMALD